MHAGAATLGGKQKVVDLTANRDGEELLRGWLYQQAYKG